MVDDCIFCKIVAGDIPATKVYEDADVLAFLDVNPLSRGHTLVIPKVHAERLEDLDEGDAEDLLRVLPDLVGAVQEAVGADGSNVGFNNGPAAGQEVPHVHGHIVPRFEGDGGAPIHAVAGPSRPDLSEDEMAGVAERIRKSLG